MVCCRKLRGLLSSACRFRFFRTTGPDAAYTERSCNHNTHFLSYHAVSATSEGIFTCFFTDAADFYDLIQKKEYCGTIRSTLSGIIRSIFPLLFETLLPALFEAILPVLSGVFFRYYLEYFSVIIWSTLSCVMSTSGSSLSGWERSEIFWKGLPSEGSALHCPCPGRLPVPSRIYHLRGRRSNRCPGCW